MAPIPSKTHNAGEAFGWQMRPRGQRRCIACAKQDCFGKQTTWRDWSASCLKGCIYFKKYMCTEHLEWDCREDPPMLGVCLGMWNFLDILHVRFMFIEPSKWRADQDAWFALQSEGCILSKSLKNHTLVPMSVKYRQVSFQKVWCHEKLCKACILLEKHRNLFLKTGSNRPKVQFWLAACITATASSLHARVLWPNSKVRAC